MFLPYKKCQAKDGSAPKWKILRRQPGYAVPHPRDGNEQGSQPGDQQEAARVVYATTYLRRLEAGQRAPRNGQSNQSQRQVDPKNPSPGKVLRQQAAQDRASNAGNGKGRADVPLVSASLSRRNDVCHNGLRAREQATPAYALNNSSSDQHGHACGQRAQH